jgi:phospholipid/cholesterol/gamma-HCH transport system substrate-binding protein
LRVAPIGLPLNPGSEGGPTAVPSNGPPSSAIQGVDAFARTTYEDSYLHSNPYPNTAAPGQPAECEAGNEGYRAGINGPGAVAIGNPGNVPSVATEKTVRKLPAGPGR